MTGQFGTRTENALEHATRVACALRSGGYAKPAEAAAAAADYIKTYHRVLLLCPNVVNLNPCSVSGALTTAGSFLGLYSAFLTLLAKLLASTVMRMLIVAVTFWSTTRTCGWRSICGMDREERGLVTGNCCRGPRTATCAANAFRAYRCASGCLLMCFWVLGGVLLGAWRGLSVGMWLVCLAKESINAASKAAQSRYVST